MVYLIASASRCKGPACGGVDVRAKVERGSSVATPTSTVYYSTGSTDDDEISAMDEDGVPRVGPRTPIAWGWGIPGGARGARTRVRAAVPRVALCMGCRCQPGTTCYSPVRHAEANVKGIVGVRTERGGGHRVVGLLATVRGGFTAPGSVDATAAIAIPGTIKLAVAANSAQRPEPCACPMRVMGMRVITVPGAGRPRQQSPLRTWP